MKRLLGFLLTLVFILSILPFSVFAAEPDLLCGNNALIEMDAERVVIDGKEFKASTEIEITAAITVSDYDSAYGAIYLNGTRIASLVNGENIISFKSSALNDNENELRIALSGGNGEYTDKTVYGSVNADDIKVESFVFSKGISGTPDSVKLYMPIENSAGTTVKTSAFSNGISVGDGWSADTKLGGTTPNVPVSVGFIFNKPSTEGVFVIDSTTINDGKHIAQFFNGTEMVAEKEFIIDNSAPVIEFSVTSNANIARLDKVGYKINDLTACESVLLIDGKKATEINVRKLSTGKHTAIVTAIDACGNTATKSLVFNVTDKKYSVVFGEDTVKMSVIGDADVYTATLIKDIRMFENQQGSANQDYLRSDDEILVSFDDKAELETKALGNALPYHSFVINTDGVKDEYVVVSYNGETGNGSDILLKAWNYKENRWDNVGETKSGESISVKVDVETYSYKKKMRINAVPNLVYNGSDTLIWNSDTQYYSRFDDLNRFYYAIANYTVDEYKAGNVGYYVHTGDLIDQTNVGDEIAHAEYNVASKAQKILDDAMVPNGVVSGNHDIVHTDADYSYYYKYFGEERYKDYEWYGGSLNNNMHHYDLVSLGSYDFVFLYLGCYKETEADTIAWANEVCKAYPDRNVVICTHEYLLPSGEYSSDRSQVIWDEIIVPNENVIMVLCGHNEGVCDQVKRVGDSDRYVLEILADYQFAELGVGPQHVLNGCTCDGEGYVRVMTFNDAGQLISTTYSPVASEFDVDPFNFYPSYSDSFVYDLKMIPANRSIKTTEFNVVYNPEKVGSIGESGISLKGSEAFYAVVENGDNDILTEVFVLDEYEVDYDPDKREEIKVPVSEKIYSGGYSNVSENFRMNEKNEFPKDDFIKVGVDLMPKNVNSLYQTSGSNVYDKAVSENGAVTITHEKGNNATWVTLANNVNKKINVDEYDRIYFGVTADKNTKWNIYVNFAGKEINFSQNKDIASLFGYVNKAPSDIQGTWNGYIDLSELVTGEQTVMSIYLVTATPGQTVTFDYLFLGKSEGGKVKFVTDDTTAIAYEAKVGDKISLPGDAFKQGHTFTGWYITNSNGEKIKVDDAITVKDTVTEVYAQFAENAVIKNEVKTYNTEINLERLAVGKLIFVIASLVIMIAVVVVLLLKIKSSKKQGNKK